MRGAPTRSASAVVHVLARKGPASDSPTQAPPARITLDSTGKGRREGRVASYAARKVGPRPARPQRDHPQSASGAQRPWQSRAPTWARDASDAGGSPPPHAPPGPKARPVTAVVAAPPARGAAFRPQPPADGARGRIGCRGPVHDGYVARLLSTLVPPAKRLFVYVGPPAGRRPTRHAPRDC